MNVGFVGLGKLGLPCALAIESKGHYVCGYDIDPNVKNILETKQLPYKEIWAQEYLEKSKIDFLNLDEVVQRSDVIFVPIQTPHDPLYEGTTRIPDSRVDFDYTWLRDGMENLSKSNFEYASFCAFLSFSFLAFSKTAIAADNSVSETTPSSFVSTSLCKTLYLCGTIHIEHSSLNK